MSSSSVSGADAHGRLCKKQKLPIYGIVQFVEVKDGQVYDFTWQGAGFRKEIER